MITDRTLVLADPAADAEIGIYIRALQHLCSSVPELHLKGLEPDRLRRCGAYLFADDTVDIHRPGQTPPPVVEGGADLERLLSGCSSQFFPDGQRGDRACGTHAAAEQPAGEGARLEFHRPVEKPVGIAARKGCKACKKQHLTRIEPSGSKSN